VEGDKLSVPQWGVTLSAPLPHRSIEWVGIRAHDLRPATEPGENVFPYEVVKTVEEPFAMVMMIRVAGTEGETIRWELSKEAYQALPAGNLVYFPPEALLCLTR
jgi:molybdate transport system ATP-binding protein